MLFLLLYLFDIFSPGVPRVGFLGTALNYKNKQTKTTKEIELFAAACYHLHKN